MASQIRFHRRCDTQGRMNTAEIVVSKMQSDSGFQMRQLFAERIGEPRKSPHRHSHGQVLPFHKRSADMSGVGVALSDFGYNPREHSV